MRAIIAYDTECLSTGDRLSVYVGLLKRQIPTTLTTESGASPHLVISRHCASAGASAGAGDLLTMSQRGFQDDMTSDQPCDVNIIDYHHTYVF